MPKLPKGMFKRGSSYAVRLSVDGKDVWRSLGGDYAEARRKLRQLRSGACPLNGKQTVTDAARRWVETYVQTARSPKNQVQTASRIERYLKPFFAFVPLWKVGPDHIRRYRLWLEGHDIKPTTVWHILSDVRCFLRWCEEVGLVERTPFPRRVMPRLPEQPADRLSEAEAASC